MEAVKIKFGDKYQIELQVVADMLPSNLLALDIRDKKGKITDSVVMDKAELTELITQLELMLKKVR